MSKRSKSKRIIFEFDCPPEYLFSNYFNRSQSRNNEGFAGWGIRWIYALLLLIVIVLQFGTNYRYKNPGNGTCPEGMYSSSGCCCSGYGTGAPENNQLIDNSVLFIIVVFLLVLCAGCWWGGYGGYGGSSGY